MITTLASRLEQVRRQIADAERQFKRIPGSVQLLAVSKAQSAETIASAYRLGQRDFGENYLQEALSKIDLLSGLSVNWHFIGHIQSNKTRDIAEHFSWVHSVDRYKTAKRLSDQRPENFKPLNICLQVNLDNEPGKGGIPAGDVLPLALQIGNLPRLQLRGLMLIPAQRDDFASQSAVFRQLHGLLTDVNANGLQMDTLSMGMSDDMIAAIAEGATMVRIGTSIFGPRP